MNSEVKATMREALTMLRDSYVEWVSGEWAREKVASIDAALAALEDDEGWERVPNGTYKFSGCNEKVKDEDCDVFNTWKITDEGLEITDTVGDWVDVEWPDGWVLHRKRPPAQG